MNTTLMPATTSPARSARSRAATEQYCPSDSGIAALDADALAATPHRTTRRRTPRVVRWAAALSVGLSAAMAVAQPAGASGPRHDVIDGLFDVDGYNMYLRCTGRGRPTVVMDASAGEDSSTWSDVEQKIARVTRVCVYDRAGLGRSEPRPLPRTSQTMVDELTTLLRVAQVPGPYVVVGHSIAGFNVQVFARQDAGESVVGAVLIDATPPDFVAVLDSIGFPIPPPEDTENNPDGLDFRASAEQALTAGPFPPIPLVVLTHGSPGDLADLEATWQAMQVAQSELSPKGRLVVAHRSGHYIQNDQPGLVVRAVAQVVAQTRHCAGRDHHDVSTN